MAFSGFGAKSDPDASARVRGWVRESLGDDSVSVLVTELACTEPGCPPIETVIGLLTEGTQAQHKIHKPVAEVSREDVDSALAALAGEPSSEQGC